MPALTSLTAAGSPKGTPEEKEQGLLPRQLLYPGQRVLTVGILELKKELEDREAEQQEHTSQP